MRRRSRREVLGALAACAASPRVVGAQSADSAPRRHSADERYELFRRHLELRARAITDNQFRGISGLEDWHRKRPEVRRQFLDALGLDPLPPRTPLNARITGGFERPHYGVENIVFESMPGFYVTDVCSTASICGCANSTWLRCGLVE
jgi:hypothetical protein